MKLSIITVNLNNIKGLQKTIDSIISQSFKDYEWIVIDGGSTDGSKELIEKYDKHISYWVSEPDKGIYNAMNKGLKIAKGEYILFINSGDYLVSSNILQKVFNKNYEEDIIYGNIVTYPKGKRLKSFHSNKIYGTDLCHDSIYHPATFTKRTLFEKMGYYDENLKIVSDWKFAFEAILIHKCSYKYINSEIAYFDTKGISSTHLELVEKERNQVLSQYLPDFAIEDYKLHLKSTEIIKYKFTKAILLLLYRITTYYQRYLT